MTLECLRVACSGRLLTDEAQMAPFLTDWRKLWRGRAIGVAQPDSVAAVAAVVRWCAANRTPIVPQGGNTGLSGGATPDTSGRALVLSLARLNRVRGIDTENSTITLDAGCILQEAQQHAEEAGRYLPLSLAAEGSCTIGGNLATNAGGTAVLRFGNARELCLGLEVVTASGEVWDGLRGLRKDNSGYDLRDLFIGSEGTLGVITGAVLKLFPRPAARVAAFAGMTSPTDALRLFDRIRSKADTALTAVELLSHACLDLVLKHAPGSRDPLQSAPPWRLLLELSDPVSEDRARTQLEELLADAMDDGLVLDAVVAQSVAQTRALWSLREGISEAQSAEGETIKHDIALPISQIPSFLAEAGEAVRTRWPAIRFVTFGHVGDGNLHYNFSPPPTADGEQFLTWQDEINHVVHDAVVRHGGSISAEHGLGVLRRDESARYKSPIELALMRCLKGALDPDGIMNPGKVLPPS